MPDPGHGQRDLLDGADWLQRGRVPSGLRRHDVEAVPSEQHSRHHGLLARTGWQLPMSARGGGGSSAMARAHSDTVRRLGGGWVGGWRGTTRTSGLVYVGHVRICDLADLLAAGRGHVRERHLRRRLPADGREPADATPVPRGGLVHVLCAQPVHPYVCTRAHGSGRFWPASNLTGWTAAFAPARRGTPPRDQLHGRPQLCRRVVAAHAVGHDDCGHLPVRLLPRRPTALLPALGHLGDVDREPVPAYVLPVAAASTRTDAQATARSSAGPPPHRRRLQRLGAQRSAA